MNKSLVIIFLFTTILCEQEGLRFLSSHLPDVDECWAVAYSRGAGKPPTVCPAGSEQWEQTCKVFCPNGFSKTLDGLCITTCPSNFRNDPLHCGKPEAYGRGAGYSIFSEDHCVGDNPQGCELWGAIYYPKCASGFSPFGCCVCSPDCPPYLTDIGVSCQKNFYARAELPIQCYEGTRMDKTNGKCYFPCDNMANEMDSVCMMWCPHGYEQCGPVCLRGKTCDEEMKELWRKKSPLVIEHANKDDNTGEMITLSNFVPHRLNKVCDLY
jgi:hypothetical protein